MYVFCIYLVWYSLELLDLWFVFFTKFGKFSAIISLWIFSLLSLFSLGLDSCIFGLFDIIPQFVGAVFSFLHTHSFFSLHCGSMISIMNVHWVFPQLFQGCWWVPPNTSSLICCFLPLVFHMTLFLDIVFMFVKIPHQFIQVVCLF